MSLNEEQLRSVVEFAVEWSPTDHIVTKIAAAGLVTHIVETILRAEALESQGFTDLVAIMSRGLDG